MHPELVARLERTRHVQNVDSPYGRDNAGQLSTLDPPGAVVPGSAYAYSDAMADIRGLFQQAPIVRIFDTGED